MVTPERTEINTYHRPIVHPRAVGGLLASHAVATPARAEGPTPETPAIFERFDTYCQAEGIDYTVVNRENSHEFASSLHRFLYTDTNAQLTETSTSEEQSHPTKAVIDSDLVERALTRYYAIYGGELSDHQRRLRRDCLTGFSSVARTHAHAFPEIEQLDTIRDVLYERGHRGASKAAIELQGGGYGQSLAALVHQKRRRAEQQHARVRDDRRYYR